MKVVIRQVVEFVQVDLKKYLSRIEYEDSSEIKRIINHVFFCQKVKTNQLHNPICLDTKIKNYLPAVFVIDVKVFQKTLHRGSARRVLGTGGPGTDGRTSGSGTTTRTVQRSVHAVFCNNTRFKLPKSHLNCVSRCPFKFVK